MINVKIQGADKVIAKLAKNILKDEAKKIVKSNGSQLTRNAQRLAPVDTSALKNSITQDIQGGGLESKTSAGVHYAGYVEYGTRFMSANPYMGNAFELQATKFQREMQALMK